MCLRSHVMQNGIFLTVPFFTGGVGLSKRIQALRMLAVWSLQILNTEMLLTELRDRLEPSITTLTARTETLQAVTDAIYAVILYALTVAVNVWAEI